jgi:hypothetical protein
MLRAIDFDSLTSFPQQDFPSEECYLAPGDKPRPRSPSKNSGKFPICWRNRRHRSRLRRGKRWKRVFKV